MSYYDTIDEDIARAKDILARGKASLDMVDMPDEVRQVLMKHQGGTIYGADTYAAYMLLESFIEEIARLKKQLDAHHLFIMTTLNFENPALYDVAKKVCHEFGMPWTDPRTGVTYEPPKQA